MVGRNDEQIACFQVVRYFRQIRIKFHQCICIPFYVPAVPEEHVKIHKIGKNKSGTGRFDGVNRGVNTLQVIGCFYISGNTFSIKNI